MAGASPKPKPRGKTRKKVLPPEQNHEVSVEEFEREGMGVASKE